MCRTLPDRGRKQALAALGLLFAASAAAQDLPTLSELEQRGVTIGRVNIEIENVFDTTDPAEDKRLYHWANRVHRPTRPSVVREVLLFAGGDPLVEQLLAESARLLRNRGYVAEAAITAGTYDPATNTVDVNVWVRDSWSLEPDIKLSRSGGENEYGIGFVEDNILGLGKSITLSYSSDVDRDQRLFGYSDSNVAGSRKRLAVTAVDLSDGRQFRVSTGRPFYALDTRWSVEGDAVDDVRIDPIYDRGKTIDEFRHHTRFVSIQGGRSPGLLDGMAKRWLAGLTLDEDEFQAKPGFGPPILLPRNRRLIYPWAGIHWIGDDYRKVTEFDDMGRTEDLSLGLNFFARLGVASPKLNSDRRAILLDVSAARGFEPGGPGNLAQFSVAASARSEKQGIANSVVSFSGRFARRNFGDELFLVSLRAVLGNNLDAENQVLLGGDNNLRGYPLRYQAGERSAVLNIEQRFYTDWYPFRLIRVGYAFFFDAGRVWGNDPRTTPNSGTLYNVGMGLRLSSPRSSGGSVVHLDFAFPLNAPADIDNLQIVIEKKATF